MPLFPKCFASLRLRAFALGCCFFFAACAPVGETFRATAIPQLTNAPVYTDTPTWTPTLTPSPTLTPTLTPSPTLTSTWTPSPTLTPSPSPTQPLWTLTPPSNEGAPAASESGGAAFSNVTGWSCDDFPCGDDIDGWLRRIQAPQGYYVEHVGQFPGQPMQITYGRDGRLYATVLENGTRNGAIYAMNGDGSTERYAGDFVSPFGLAFQPGTDTLYVSARVTLEEGGGVWRVDPDGTITPVISDLPCCFMTIDNQPNGLIFGADGYLYVGVGALSDHGENRTRSADGVVNLQANEASVLRIQPHTGDYLIYAQGIRNPVDLALDSTGTLYSTDSGLLTGFGNRLLRLQANAHFGFPYWRDRGCNECWIKPAIIETLPDLVGLPPMSLPRGVVVYTGDQYPQNLFDNLFVTLWNGVEEGQRVVRIDPDAVNNPEYAPEPFITGLIRPIDITVAPDGSLVVVDYVYGHVWRVVYGA